MGYASLPNNVRAAAERVLTRKQLDVFKLRYNGHSYVQISLILGVSEPTIRAHLRRAHQKIKPYLEEAA